MSNQLTKETRSCFDCKHARVWTDKTGFECTHPSLTGDENWVEPECYLTMTYEEFALYCAGSCRDYEE